MQKYFQICRFPYSNHMIFDLVSDVSKYPEFLPWCNRVIIHKSSPNNIIATLFVGNNIFSGSFKSKVILTRPDYIKIYYETGPFKYLQNTWGFRKVSSYVTEVSFFVNFEFNSIILETAVDSFFSNLTRNMMKAFQDRAYLLSNKRS